MHSGFFECIISWDDIIDCLTLDSRGNIYFISRNRVYKWHYDYGFIEPFYSLPSSVEDKITLIHVVQETDDLLVVINCNSIYSLHQEGYVFQTEKTISRVVNCGQDLWLIVEGSCLVIRDYPTGSKSEEVSFYYFAMDDELYSRNIFDILTSSSGVLYILMFRYGNTHYFKALSSKDTKLTVEHQITFMGCRNGCIQYNGNTPTLLVYSNYGVIYLEPNDLPLKETTPGTFLVPGKIQDNKYFFKRETILWKDVPGKFTSLKFSQTVKSTSIDKDENGIILLPNNIWRVQINEPSSPLLYYQQDFVRHYKRGGLTTSEILDGTKRLDSSILSVRMGDNKFF